MFYKKIGILFALVHDGFASNKNLVHVSSLDSQILRCSNVANENVFPSPPYIRFHSLFAWDKDIYPTFKDPYVLWVLPCLCPYLF